MILPSTLCGSGMPLGIAMLLLIGLVCDWSSRALVKATCKTQSESLEQMFQVVLGRKARMIYSLSLLVVLLSIPVVCTLIAVTFTNDVYVQWKGKDTEKINFRVIMLIFASLSGLSLFVRSLQTLGYVSMIRIAGIVGILVVVLSYAPGEFDLRRKNQIEQQSFSSEFPMSPTMLGSMKALGCWHTAYMFHMGIAELFFNMKDRSYSRWSRVSKIAMTLVTVLNVCYALIGYLATTNQMHPDNNLCTTDKDTFLSLYHTDRHNDRAKWIILMICRVFIILVVLVRYPLFFIYLRTCTIQILTDIAPEKVASKSKSYVSNVTTIVLWVVVTAACMITENVFAVLGLMFCVFGTMIIFLMPALSWIQIHGGMRHVLSLGLCTTKTIPVEVPSTSASTIAIDIRVQQEHVKSKASIYDMLMANVTVYLSVVFIANGLCITLLEITREQIKWRDTLDDYNWTGSA